MKGCGQLNSRAFKKDLFHLAICHGHAALLSAKPANNTEPFIFSGYKIAAFSDKVDRQIPLIRYLYGQVIWFFGEKLNELGGE